MIAADMLSHDIRKQQPPHPTHDTHTHTRTLCPSFSLLLPWLQTGEIILSATKKRLPEMQNQTE